MQKFVKNITGSELIIAGTSVAAGAFFEIQNERLQKFAYQQSVVDKINADQVLLSRDGSTTLSKADSLLFLREVEWAQNVTFDNENNSFDSTNVQDAIEENTNSPRGALDVHTFIELGTAKNEWLAYYGNSINSDETFAIIPFDAQLIACSFTNEKDDIDTDIEVHKASEGSGNNTSKVATFEIRNLRVARFSNFTPIQFNAGDKFAVFLDDQGTDPKNVVVRLYFMVTSFNKENDGEDFSSDFSLGIGGITVTIG